MPAFTFSETEQLLRLDNGMLRLAWSREDGALCLVERVAGSTLIRRCSAYPVVDVACNHAQDWLGARFFVRYLSHSVSDEAGVAVVTIIIGLGPLKLADRYEVAGALIRRSVTLTNVSLDAMRVFAVRMNWPDLQLSAGTWHFEAPGNSVRPRVPLEVAAAQRLHLLPRRFFAPGLRRNSALEPAPALGPGLIALTGRPANVDTAETLLCWYYSEAQAATPFVEGAGGDGSAALTLGHTVELARVLASDQQSTLTAQLLLLVPLDWPQALDQFREIMLPLGPEPLVNRAEWISDAALYEVHPGFFGGFRGLAARLPALVELGITALVLLPIWQHQPVLGRAWEADELTDDDVYAVRDFMHLDPTLGTADELRSLVATAHSYGLRVLVDFPLHGCSSDADCVTEHPDWFLYDEDGMPAAPTRAGSDRARAGCIRFNAANPELQAYLYEQAIRHFQQYGFDGYRIVGPYTPLPHWADGASEAGNAIGMLPLLRRLRHTLRQRKRDAVLICDLHGPLFSQVHDACYDYVVHHMFVHMALNRVTPAELGDYLADYQATWPAADVRCCFVETHETCDLNPIADGLRGSRISRMLLAGMIYCGFVPVMRSGQEEDYRALRELLQLRQAHTVLRRGSVLYRRVQCDSPHVFSVTRVLGSAIVVGLLHIAPHRRTVTVNLAPIVADTAAGPYRLRELSQQHCWPEEARSAWSLTELGQVRLTLEPFSAYCLSLELYEDEAAIVCGMAQPAVE